ncbi:MAG: hypothetical protein ABSA97_05710 [Verrucomicrobiia bacterium]|jgi:hypothetical protein
MPGSQLSFEAAASADGDGAGGVEVGAEGAEDFHVAVFGGFDESEDDVRALRKKLGIVAEFPVDGHVRVRGGV